MSAVAVTPVTNASHSRWWPLAIVASASSMISLDLTVVVVALPRIQFDLSMSIAELQWVIVAYSIAFAVFLVSAGALGDRYGHNRLFSIGIGLFTAASLLCGFAFDGLSMSAGRALQGLGAAMLMGNGLALLSINYPKPVERARVFGLWGATIGIGMAVGPLVGGLIAEYLGWRWVFLANGPIGAALLGSLRMLGPGAATSMRRLDVAGMVAAAIALFGVVWVLTFAPDHGLKDPSVVAAGIAGLLSAVAFVVIERRVAEPMLDLGLLADRRFAAISVVPVLLSVGFWALFIYLPLYYEQVIGLAPIDTGIALLPLTLPIVLGPLIGASVFRRLSVGRFFVLGLGLVGVGDFALAIDVWMHPPTTWLVWIALATIGAGAGLINPQISSVAVAMVPPARAGVASGMSGTMRQVGFAIGIAAMGAVLSAFTGEGPAEGAAAAMPFAMAIGFGGIVAILGAALVAWLFSIGSAGKKR